MHNKLTLSVDGIGAAFADDSEEQAEDRFGTAWSGDAAIEFARILRAVADAVEGDGAYPDIHTLRDINGSACGTVTIEVI